MSGAKAQRTTAAVTGVPTSRPTFVQRKCACGNSMGGLEETCGSCGTGIQRKLSLGSTTDPLEAEADRVADQVVTGTRGGDRDASRAIASEPPRIRRLSTQPRNDGHVPSSVERVLSTTGAPLEPALRSDFEHRMGHDFSRVRIHTGAAAAASAREITARAYTAGSDIVFGEGQYSPTTTQGKKLLAHELTHVVQQRGAELVAPVARAGLVQRDPLVGNLAMAPEALLSKYFGEMWAERFDHVSHQLYLGFMTHPEPTHYLQDVFGYANDHFDQWEDSLAAAFVQHLQDSQLDALAKSEHGRYALSLMYKAMITGDVTDFEREQANRVLFAKVRRLSPSQYAAEAQSREGKGEHPTRVFPVRFMRVFGGDYAPPLATLKPDGMIHVSYPANMRSMDMFAEERKTIGNFIGHGDDISANEIVLIRDYEHYTDNSHYTETPLPALALIDYSNQAVNSTIGKIVEVSMVAATMGIGSGGAVAAEGGEAAAARITATAIWGARLARAATYIDDAANLISLASLAIKENSEWLEKKLGRVGKALVIAAEVTDTALAIYGVARLAHTGFKFAKKFYSASLAVCRTLCASASVVAV